MMGMFQEQFYPTPDAVIDRMLAPFTEEYHGYYGLGDRRPILDPSAGKGNILDRLKGRYQVQKRDLLAIEIDPELQMILSEKGYRVIDSDFLTYRDQYVVRLIVMNPPFDEGAAHLLKAWEILHSGDIVCCLNAETLRNPFTKEREVLAERVRLSGTVEYIGQAFKDAERSTDVEVALVWLHKDAPEAAFDFAPGSVETDAGVNEAEFSANPLANPDVLNNLVLQYEKAAELLIAAQRLQAEYAFYTQDITQWGLSVNNDSSHDPATSLNSQIDALKRQFWEYVFAKTKIGQQTTSNFRRKFDEFARDTSNLAFSEANLRRILSLFFLNRDQIMQDCVVEVFDKATGYHKDNKFHPEGWDHNKSWKLAPLIIIPYGIHYDKKFDHWSHYYDSHSDFYGDIDRALCFLDGLKIEEIHSTNTALQNFTQHLGMRTGSRRYDEEFESTYFTIRIYKKGTVHLKFRDRALLDHFNETAAKGKQWIGQGF